MVGCFGDCSDNYFPMGVEYYSIFKNDVYVHKILNHPEYFITYDKKEIEEIFPIRIVLNNELIIPQYTDEENINAMQMYTEDNNKINVSDLNYKIIKNFKHSIIKNKITSTSPGNYTSRELCNLYHMDLYFYVVVDNNFILKPFILVSKYDFNEICSKILEKGKNVPQGLKLLFHKNQHILRPTQRRSLRPRQRRSLRPTQRRSLSLKSTRSLRPKSKRSLSLKSKRSLG